MYKPPTADAPEITCPTCNFSNPPTRLYCQDCGAKLARGSSIGLLPTAPESPVAPPPVQLRGGPPKPLPQAGKPVTFFGTLFSLIRLTLYAALTAAIIQALRPPAEIPPVESAIPEEMSQTILDRLTSLSSNQTTGVMSLPWTMVNQYLSGRVPATPMSGAFGLKVEFVRIALANHDGKVQALMERRVGNYPIYLSLDLVSSSDSGTSRMRITGGQIGRLPIPGSVAGLLAGAFKPATERLSYELNLLRSARSVAASPESVSVSFK